MTTSVTTSVPGCHVVTDPRRDSNRGQFPDVADLVDALRASFGEDQVKVLWIKGGSIEKGKRPEWLTDAD